MAYVDRLILLICLCGGLYGSLVNMDQERTIQRLELEVHILRSDLEQADPPISRMVRQLEAGGHKVSIKYETTQPTTQE